jgi:hypothetical protein
MLTKIKHFWMNNSGFGNFITPVLIVAIALAGSAITLGILYTSIKVLAANTGQTIINVAP